MTAARRRNPRALALLLLTGWVLLGLTAGMLSGAPPAAASGPSEMSASAGVTPASAGVTPASRVVYAADLSKFQPGNIISNAVFFNKSTMTEAQIQAFLQAKVPVCQSGYTCLKDWYDTSRTTAADPMCGPYAGGVRERASRIIYKVAQACGINPQVLLTTLQKEQGLVTHTWPSDWRYRAAMGQGCPDTAACDTRYYGFFNQVLGAAWQMKRYANPPGTSQYFTWYAPGNTWNLRYHPNVACGTSPVFVQNQATANLYYYTPYQPNAAALRAGYGLGDGCSAYGNRNFYNYFTDWFGSTQTVSQTLMKVGSDVWIVTGALRYHITAEAYPEYRRIFGAPASVDAAYLGLFADSGLAHVYVRNSSTGEVAMLQDGKTHRFASCAMVAAWGGACGSALVQLANREFVRAGVGLAMSDFAYPAAGARIHRLVGTELRPVFDAATAARMNGGVAPYAALMRPAVTARYTVASRIAFATGDFVLQSGAPEVYLALADGRLFHLRSWLQASELGLPATVAARAPATDLAGYTKSGDVSTFVRCGASTYFAAAGTLSLLSAGPPAGFTVMPSDSATCARLRLTGPAVSGKLFVKVVGESAVYDLVAGQARRVANQPQLVALNGGTWPTILSISKAAFALYPMGEPYPSTGVLAAPEAAPDAADADAPVSGDLVRASNSPSVTLVDASRRLGIPNWGVAADLGVQSRYRIVPAESVAAIPQAAQSVGVFVRCGTTDLIAAQGVLSPVTAAGLAGVTAVPLDAATCATLTRTGAVIAGRIFVQAGGSTTIYVVQGGGLHALAPGESPTTLNGGTAPRILTLDPRTIAGIPAT